jgi:hypothetical protein
MSLTFRTKLCVLTATGVLLALASSISTVRASDWTDNPGPVQAWEPILSGFGEKRLIAFYDPADDSCAIQAVIWNSEDVEARSASRLRINLRHGETAHLDSVNKVSLGLRCDGRLALIPQD